MEEIKRRFIDTVAGKLAAAPQSTAKDELVEELSDNLYRRFLDMTGAGMDDEAAFNRAMEDLGDVDELLAYLGTEAAGGRQSQGTAEGGEDPQAGPDAGAQSDLDAILASVSEVCNTAIDQAKAALKQAKEAIQRRTSVEKDSGHVRVHFNTRPDAPEPPEPPT
ncbi:MAG: permease prefix domain 1-containing protein, partial [Oscillospiraceae bacterium]|nr:permease prefix domain 1-containing protein [Oscillospiraceae bacterium]